VLLCQQGLSDRTTGWDKGLFDLCEAAEDAGFELVWDGEYPAFGAMDENGAYDALLDSLDESGDGLFDYRDTPARIHLVGFSWGGINVTDIAERLRKEARIAPSRRGISALVLLDPFQPQISRAVIPSNVFRAWEYRQTDTTEGDCSIDASLGFGFNGHRPKAKSEMTFCTYYDLDAFQDGVGHCDVPVAAAEAALHNLVALTDYEPWSKHAVDCPLD
jgi:pimeloyl-ACP methyl ester carboxylesterase